MCGIVTGGPEIRYVAVLPVRRCVVPIFRLYSDSHGPKYKGK
jgi:hypothetical protein